ncbi:YbaB/EbfC family nucleoid-associated protein [Nocardia macrotermitis]|uniref:YbaB/EbfC DNA-binding family protein n=1 Tax=Nocardia macrotermitis TaxID=2585198 RepID=A0A7K0D9P8_9NOCA|nr:YbaB/EbfC family nucleoid-associated protein [Nocardia macrotermitis]MQY22493.1 hypothetical protein [Nocardia macrotermitis]
MSNQNDRLITDASQVLDSIFAAMEQAEQARHKRDTLTGNAQVERGRIAVTVNASGSITEVTFSDDVEDLTYSRIARATLEAAQQAAAEVKRKNEELLAPLLAARAAIPQLSDLVQGLPALRDRITEPSVAPLTRPSERQTDSPVAGFDDSVEYRPTRRSTFDR